MTLPTITAGDLIKREWDSRPYRIVAIAPNGTLFCLPALRDGMFYPTAFPPDRQDHLVKIDPPDNPPNQEQAP